MAHRDRFPRVPASGTLAQLNALGLGAAHLGAVAWCTDWTGGACLVTFNGANWIDFSQSLLRGGSRQIPRVGEVGGLVMPAIPILTVFQGSSGTSLTLQNAVVVATSSDSVYLELIYEFFSNTASGTHTGFLINTVAQWKIAAFFAGAATSPTDGLPRPLARGANGVLWFQNNVIANHIICVGITLVKS